MREVVVTEDQSGHRGTFVGHKVMETPGEVVPQHVTFKSELR